MLSRLPSFSRVPLFASLRSSKRLFGSTSAMFAGTRASDWTVTPQFVSDGPSFPILRLMDEEGKLVEGSLPWDEATSMRIYQTMVKVLMYDQVLYDVQRQGRISFYMTNYGEEATQLGVAAALSDEDMVWPQYRELGVFLWRGFTAQMMTDQCMSTEFEVGKGRQMPVHYCFPEKSIQAITSPLGTNIPHAAGAGYAFKLEKKDRCAVAFFGDGAASEGDFACALNFAATMKSQTLFICRNNGYAISTPVSEQYAGDGIAGRGVAYGIPSIRVDGNDVVAVYKACEAARKMTVEGKGPVLLELMTYRWGQRKGGGKGWSSEGKWVSFLRRGHHSTSDDATRYRGSGEVENWGSDGVEPISRMRKLVLDKGYITEEEDDKFRKACRKEILNALKESEKKLRAPVADMFNDVYSELPWHLKEQYKELRDHVERNKDKYNLNLYRSL